MPWIAFSLSGIFWGTSFLWIKIALREVDPLTLVAFRLLFGAVGLNILLAFSKNKIPRDYRIWVRLLILSFLSPVVPFILISWGEVFVSSGVAAILNGTSPMFALVFAHFFLSDEKMTVERVVGLLLGFAGIVILMSKDLHLAALFDFNNLLGQLAILLASISYAASAVYTKRYLSGVPSLVQATAIITIGDIIMWILVFFSVPNYHMPEQMLTWVSLAWLGILGTCIAFALYFYLIKTWGPSRSTLVTYILPVVGIILGIIFLNEPMDYRIFVGTALILGGIFLVNMKKYLAQARRR